MIVETAASVLSRAAQRTQAYDFSVWFWGDAIAVDGMLEAAALTSNAALFEGVDTILRRWQDREPSWTDHLVPGSALLRCGLEGARLAQWLTSVPTAGGAPLYRPDQPQYRHTVWVDSLYHVPPFFASLGAKTSDTDWKQQAYDSWAKHTEVLRDPRGPFLAHSFDTGSRLRHGYGWGRGSGWALLGMIDTLRAGTDSPGWARDEFVSLATAVLQVQDASGFWRTLLHDRESYLETSATAFMGAAFTAAHHAGVLPKAFAESAERAWSAVTSRVDKDGSCWGVSACTWAGSSPDNDEAMYKALPTEVNVWGQGSVMRFAAERVRAGLA